MKLGRLLPMRRMKPVVLRRGDCFGESPDLVLDLAEQAPSPKDTASSQAPPKDTPPRKVGTR